MSFESLPSFDSVFGEHANESAASELSAGGCEGFCSGKWSHKEEKDFSDAIRAHGSNNVSLVQSIVRTRSKAQVRNRIQKLKVKQEQGEYADRYQHRSTL